MRNWIIAAAIALSAPLAAAVPAAQAQTRVIITDNDRGGPHHDRRWHRDRHDRDWRHERRAERRDRGCTTRKVVRYVHGERLVKTTRVCR